MADVFISCAREDAESARRFAEGFQSAGLSVWWDDALRPGEIFDESIERALRAAKAVVVLWSTHSVASRWVRAEATQADRNRTPVPLPATGWLLLSGLAGLGLSRRRLAA